MLSGFKCWSAYLVVPGSDLAISGLSSGPRFKSGQIYWVTLHTAFQNYLPRGGRRLLMETIALLAMRAKSLF